jgi:glycosyltransferase involved in cell wall biosynthesis
LTDGVNIVHAHFLFSDGGVGYLLNKKLDIPFITAVRNTDINIFWKYLFFYRFFGRKIAYSSGKLIFIAPSYANQLKWRPYNSKISIIPNGLNDSWFNNISTKNTNKNTLRFLYVGSFLKNKRVPLLINWITKLNKKIDCTLTLVGGGGDDENKILNFLNSDSNNILRFLGQINDEKELRKVYNEHNSLVLISRFETFGLVCIEALSQGLPIIFTSGQGVDGLFQSGDFAFPISNNSYDEFEKAALIIQRSKCVSNVNAINASKRFEWKFIADNYLNVYTECISEGNLLNEYKIT